MILKRVRGAFFEFQLIRDTHPSSRFIFIPAIPAIESHRHIPLFFFHEWIHFESVFFPLYSENYIPNFLDEQRNHPL